MSEMNEKQSADCFLNGLKKSASSARQLARLKKKKSWEHVAVMLDRLRTQGFELFNQKALTETEVLKTVDERQKQLVIN